MFWDTTTLAAMAALVRSGPLDISSAPRTQVSAALVVVIRLAEHVLSKISDLDPIFLCTNGIGIP
jgi:hypothetical protein